jgi:PAS domain S-box-containing protein
MSTLQELPDFHGALAPATYFDKVEAHAHTVQFYGDDSFLLDGLGRFVGSALGAGDASIIIATRAHRDALAQRLQSCGLDLAVATQQGRLITLDAAETLARFMVDGWPDAELFRLFIGGLVEQARLASRTEKPRIAAFGEMVALLCSEGKTEAAIRLEQLWNDLARSHAFHLHCAYPIAFFYEERHAALIAKVCAEHTHVIPDESYTSLATEEERLRSITLLQQKAQALATEVAERRKIQYALQLREAELTDFLENALIGMQWLTADGTVLWANKAEISMLGYKREEYIGHHIREFHADQPILEDILRRMGRHEELHGYEAALRCKDGSVRHVRIHSNVFAQNGRFMHTRCFSVDVTERKRMEQALLLTEKLASVGRLAASIAHEINNPLEAVTNLIYLANRDLDNPARAAQYLRSATHELDRVAHIARQTLGFYRDNCSPAGIKVSQLLDDVLFLYSKKIEGRNIRTVKEYDDEAMATVLEGEIRQVFSNLIANAIDAMPSGGTLRLRVKRARGWNNANLSGVRISVADNGSGIEPQHRKHLFQPFYTTKKDVGTGLGLWISRGIIQKHGGVIRVRSKTGFGQSGTAFSIFLPIAPPENENRVAQSKTETAGPQNTSAIQSVAGA